MKWIRLISALFVGVSAFAAHADDTSLNEVDPAVEQIAPATTITNTTRPSKAKANNRSEKPDYAPAQDMLLQAMSLIGVKYKWGGATPEAGLDCSGFVRYVFQNSMNIALPHNALGMAQSGASIDKEELKPGDLVFFNTLGRTFSHVGIYMGDNRFIHSPRAGKSVEITNLNQSYWTSRFTGARRYDGAEGTPVNMATLLAQVPKQSSSARAKPVCKTVKRKGKKHLVCETLKLERESSSARAKTSKSGKSQVSNKAASKTSRKAAAKSSKSSKTSSKATKYKSTSKTVTKHTTSKKNK